MRRRLRPEWSFQANVIWWFENPSLQQKWKQMFPTEQIKNKLNCDDRGQDGHKRKKLLYDFWIDGVEGDLDGLKQIITSSPLSWTVPIANVFVLSGKWEPVWLASLALLDALPN